MLVHSGGSKASNETDPPAKGVAHEEKGALLAFLVAANVHSPVFRDQCRPFAAGFLSETEPMCSRPGQAPQAFQTPVSQGPEWSQAPAENLPLL